MIYVVGCAARQPLITKYLNGIEHQVYITPDYVLPEDFEVAQPYKRLVWNQQNHMRCNYGHRDVMRAMGREALIIEDDAVPNCKNWYEICLEARKLLDEFKIVSLHTRSMERPVWKQRPFMDREIWIRGGGWGVGSLAYWIRDDVAKYFINRPYTGLPMDLSLYEIASKAGSNGNKDKLFCTVYPSPFDHGDGKENTLMNPDGKFRD
jgi:hypothetical protein